MENDVINQATQRQHSYQQDYVYGGVAGQIPVPNLVVNPSIPSLLGRTNEILNHLSTAEMHVARFRGDVFGEGESKDSSHMAKSPTTLEGMLSDACERVAILCGQLSTINTRMGISQAPQSAASNSIR